jgi:hypothetical protein
VHNGKLVCCSVDRIVDNYVQVSAMKKSREVEDLESLRMLQLARASRHSFSAQVQYCRLRLQEIEVMRTIAMDECDAAEAALQRAESQVGELRHVLHSNGTALGDSGIKLFSGKGNDSDDEFSFKDYKSPTPDDDNHAI